MQNQIVLDVVKKLTDEIVWQCHYNNQYRRLFMHSELRNQLLSETAFRFFKDIQLFYWHQMIMGVSRLTDKHEQGNFRNLSVQILSVFGHQYSWNFTDDLVLKVNDVVEISEPIRIMRKKYVAHRDFEHAMGNTITLGPLEIEIVDSSLDKLCDLMDYIKLKLDLPGQHWELSTPRGVDALIYHLKLAHLCKEQSKVSIEERKTLDLELSSSSYKDA